MSMFGRVDLIFQFKPEEPDAYFNKMQTFHKYFSLLFREVLWIL